jgi:hypothetical protein
MSIRVHSGVKDIITATINPIGFMNSASIKLPLVNETMERVEPQEGQGIFVICFIRHTSNASLLVSKLLKLK